MSRKQKAARTKRAAYRSRLIPIIMAGGGGDRTNPLGTVRDPKQLQPITADDLTLVEHALDRLAKYERGVLERTLIVTQTFLRDKIARFLRKRFGTINIVCDPAKRDTAGAVIWGILNARFKFGDFGLADPVYGIFTADHVIADRNPDDRYDFSRHELLHEAIEVGCAAAANGGHIVTFGVDPRGEPSSKYGHIVPADEAKARGAAKPNVDAGDWALGLVQRFTEKPLIEESKALIAQGATFNSGMFLGTWQTWENAIRVSPREDHRYAKILDGMLGAIAESKDGIDSPDVGKRFEDLPKLSIDFAVMNYLKPATEPNILVVPLSGIFWQDLGRAGGREVKAVTSPDGHGNHVRGKGVLAQQGVQGGVFHIDDGRLVVMAEPGELDTCVFIKNAYGNFQICPEEAWDGRDPLKKAWTALKGDDSEIRMYYTGEVTPEQRHARGHVRQVSLEELRQRRPLDNICLADNGLVEVVGIENLYVVQVGNTAYVLSQALLEHGECLFVEPPPRRYRESTRSGTAEGITVERICLTAPERHAERFTRKPTFAIVRVNEGSVFCEVDQHIEHLLEPRSELIVRAGSLITLSSDRDAEVCMITVNPDKPNRGKNYLGLLEIEVGPDGEVREAGRFE